MLRDPGHRKTRIVSMAEAEELAIAALGFMAQDPDRIGRFLSITGLGPENLRQAAGQAGFLASVLDYLAQDERLLMAFAEVERIAPETVTRAHAALTGSPTP